MHPSFSIAGMPKSGTSALYFYLKHHPQLVLMPKEVNALEGHTGAMSWSKSYFELLPSIENVCQDCLVGEANIGMGGADPAAYRFVLPSLSVIFLLLRHPAKHMYASYWFWCTPQEVEQNIEGCRPGQALWNPRKNITYVDTNNLTQWHSFPR